MRRLPALFAVVARRGTVARLAAASSLALVLGALVGGVPPAGAGGWASASLDPLPAIAPGEAVPIGFTVRAHGSTPVDLSHTAAPAAAAVWEERGVDPRAIGVSVVDATGRESFFPAVPDGAVGHYVADVAFPSTGTFTWAAHQGIYGAWDLGTIHVTPDGATPSWDPSSVDGAPAPNGAPLPPPPDAPADRTVERSGDAGTPLALRLALPAVAVAAIAWLRRDARTRPSATAADELARRARSADRAAVSAPA